MSAPREFNKALLWPPLVVWFLIGAGASSCLYSNPYQPALIALVVFGAMTSGNIAWVVLGSSRPESVRWLEPAWFGVFCLSGIAYALLRLAGIPHEQHILGSTVTGYGSFAILAFLTWMYLGRIEQRH